MKKLKIILQYKYVIIALIFIIYSLILNTIEVSSKYDINDSIISGVIDSYIIDGNKLSIELIGKEKIICSYYFEAEKELTYFKNNYKLGDNIQIKGNMVIPSSNRVFNLFNYKEYLKHEGINYMFKIDSIDKISSNKNILYKIKNKIISLLDKSVNKEYLYTFILGNSKYIDSNVLDSYRINGISHLFAVSGMHVSLFTLIILKLLNKFKYKNTIVIIFLIFYMFLTSFSPSILRAGIFFILLYINKKLKLNISVINIMMILLSILIIIDPYIIYKISFQYSYIISLYLLLFNKLISNCKNKISKLFVVSLISFLASLPITINNFFSINILSIVLNILFVPIISSLIFPISLIVIFISKLNILLKVLIDIFEYLSVLLAKIDILVFTMSKMSFLIIVFYYIMITFVLISITNKKYKNTFILIIILIIHYNISIFNSNMLLTFIDVGQGDSILIKMPNDKSNILIDTGGIENYTNEKWMIKNNNYNMGRDTIVMYLKSIGIRNIEYLILTHGDYDHSGSAIDIINNIKVSNVIFNVGNYNDLEMKLIKTLKEKGIKYYKNPKIIDIEDNKLYFLNTKEYNNENDNSNVIYFKYNGIKMLFMGDAGIYKEKDILLKYNLNDIDILKVGHHGSNTSTSKHFISKINPKTCLISVGENNRYGHPNESILSILKDCSIYRTDLNGSINIKIKKNIYQIKTINNNVTKCNTDT